MMGFKKHSGLIILFVFMIGCVVTLWITALYPVMTFVEEENNSVAGFDSLNEKISKEIPPPPAGIELDRSLRLGIDNSKPIHGRILVLYYSPTIEANVIDDDILQYYQRNLQVNGWVISEDYRSSGFNQIEFKKNTACILVDLLVDEYQLTIWHDFLDQNFSPTLPDQWLLEIIDVGKTDVWTCPYEF